MSRLPYIKVFCDLADTLDEMPDNEAGRLFKALLKYGQSGEEIELRGAERYVFRMLKTQINRDCESYESICERNRKNGSNGGRPKTQSKPNNPVGILETENNPDNPVGILETQTTQTRQDKDKEKDKDEYNEDEEEHRAREEIAKVWKYCYGEKPSEQTLDRLMSYKSVLLFGDGVIENAIRMSGYKGAASPLPYISEVLQDWHYAGVTTGDDVETLMYLRKAAEGRAGLDMHEAQKRLDAMRDRKLGELNVSSADKAAG